MNKHKWNVIYEVNDQVWLVFKNIKIIKSCKDLKDKQLNFYSITVKVEIFYRFQLSRSMKHIHSMFSSKCLWSSLNNLLLKQHSEIFKSMIIEKNEKYWKVNDILNFRWYKERLHWQNHEMKKVNISWFLLTFSELAVNLMYQLMIKISWLFQLLADY